MVEEPEVGEIVVVKVSKVLGYGAFVQLPEYGNRPGFIHISQVASRWVKNIRNYVKENQTRAAQVLFVDREKNQIDLSLAKVSQQAARQRIESWKQFKRARKLIEILAKSQKRPFDKAWEEVAVPLSEKHGSLFEAFQEISLHGERVTEGIPKEWLKPLVELIKKSVSVPMKSVKGTISIKSEAPDAIKKIKKALVDSVSKAREAQVEIYYKGGGSYEIKSKATNFKTAEMDLNAVKDFIVAEIEDEKGRVEFKKTG